MHIQLGMYVGRMEQGDPGRLSTSDGSAPDPFCVSRLR
jgi:hypothetical protein